MAEPTELKQRNSIAWTILSALVPFALLVWFHKTNRQINRLNQARGHDRQVLNPWWLTGPTLLMTALAAAFVVSWLSSGVDLLVIIPGGGSGSSLAGQAVDSGSWIDGRQLIESISQSGWTLIWLAATAVVGLAAAAAYIIYLLQQIEAVATLGGTGQDKTLMVIMAILSLVSVAYLVLYVVYKSQEIINRAVGRARREL